MGEATSQQLSHQLHSQFAADDSGSALQAFDCRAAIVGIK
jgi:hypothetical protein